MKKFKKMIASLLVAAMLLSQASVMPVLAEGPEDDDQLETIVETDDGDDSIDLDGKMKWEDNEIPASDASGPEDPALPDTNPEFEETEDSITKESDGIEEETAEEVIVEDPTENPALDEVMPEPALLPADVQESPDLFDRMFAGLQLMLSDMSPFSSGAYTTGEFTSNYDDLGGVQVLFEAGEPKIVLHANDTSRVYGEDYEPNGITMTVYGIPAEKQTAFDYKEVFKNMGMAIMVEGDTAQNERTAAGVYTAYVACQVSAVEYDDYALAVSSDQNGKINVSRRPITLETVDATKTYGDDDPEFKYVVAEGVIVNGDELYKSADRGVYRSRNGEATEQVNAEGYQLLCALTNSNYQITYNNNGRLYINKATLTITGGFTDASANFKQTHTREYGDKDLAPGYSVAGLQFEDAVGNSSNPKNLGDVTVSFTATSTSVPNSYSVIPSGLDNLNNYDVVWNRGTLTVEKRSIQITVDDISKTYGDSDPEITYEITAPVSAAPTRPTQAWDGKALVALNGSVTRVAGESAGSYAILNGYTAAQNPYYSISFTANDFVIKQAPLTISVNDSEKFYGEPNPAFTVEYNGLKFGETPDNNTLTGSLVLTTAADETSSVGQYDVFASGYGAGGNYKITYVKGVLTVKARPITVTLDAKTQVYGEARKTLTYSLSSSLGDALVDGDALTGGIATDPEDAYLVGEYDIVSTLAHPDYAISVIPAKYVVTPRPITVLIDDKASIYGEPMKELTYLVECALGEALVFGDVLTGGLSMVPENQKTVGTYKIVSSLANPNYQITVREGTYTVTPRPIVITIDNKESVYGEEKHPLTYTVESTLGSAIIDGDMFEGEIYVDADEFHDAGSYTIKSSLNNENYEIEVVNGTYIIHQRPIKVVIDDKTTVYGERVEKLTYSLECEYGEALVFGDMLNGGLISNPGDIKNVGEYEILSTFNHKNYAIEVENGTYTVTPRPITLTVRDHSSIYGEELEGLTYELDCEIGAPLIDGDELVGLLETDPAFATEAGTYEIICTLDNPNYTIEYVIGTYTVYPRPITLTVGDYTQVYGETLYVLEYELDCELGDALVADDELEGVLETMPAGAFEAGVYEIICTLSNPNYDIEYILGTYTIHQRPITVRIDAKTTEYGDELEALTYTLECAHGDVLVYEDTLDGGLSLSPAGSVDVGTYAIVSTLENKNYAITVVGAEYIITPAPITVTMEEMAKLYGTETIAPKLALAGFKGNDSAEMMHEIMTVAIVTGTGAVLPGASVTISPDVAGNKGYVEDGEDIKAIYKEAFKFSEVTIGNYTYGMAASDLSITRLVIEEDMYVVSGALRNSGAYKGDVTLIAPENFLISFSDELEDNDWEESLTISGSGEHEVKVFVKRESDNAISTSDIVNLTIKNSSGSSGEVDNPQTGNDFISEIVGLLTVLVIGGLALAVVVILPKKMKGKKSKKKEDVDE